MAEKVVVTGIGVISPVGSNLETAWENLKAGVSGAGPVTLLDVTEFKTKIACEVKDFNPLDYMDKRDVSRHDRFTQFCLASSREAMQHAKLTVGNFDPDRTAVIFGIGVGGLGSAERSTATLRARGPLRLPPMTIPQMISNIGPAYVAIQHQVYGPVYVVTTACTSGTDAINIAMQHIRSGIVDIAIAGGSESPITGMGIGGFNALQALSTKFNDQPTRASRPFDAERDGFVIAEGSAVMILESETHARNRGIPILAEIAGAASTTDAHHPIAPHGEGRGIIQAMRRALKDASVIPQDIDYINAHGTSTKLNDSVETASIKEVFGEHAYKLKISSTKSMHGHMIGGTGVMEAIACVQATREGFIPPTINYENPDPACDLDYTPNVGVSQEVEYAMSSSLGFGGHNGVIVVHRYA